MPTGIVLTASGVSIGRWLEDEKQTPLVCLSYPLGLLVYLQDFYHGPADKVTIAPEDVVLNICTRPDASKIQTCAIASNLKQIIIFESGIEDIDPQSLVDFQTKLKEAETFYLLIMAPTIKELQRPLGQAILEKGPLRVCQVESSHIYYNHPNFSLLMAGLLIRHRVLSPASRPPYLSDN